MNQQPKFVPTYACEICGKTKSAGSHAKCSKIKQSRFAAAKAKK